MFRPLRMLCLGIAVIAIANCSKSDAKKPLRIATAASLAAAFDAIAEAYTKETGAEVSLVIASSGKLSQQIVEGAPYDVFASADRVYTEQLVASGDAIGDTHKVYAQGRLTMWVKSGDAPQKLSELTEDRFEHVAIANPKHAPYGSAAEEALQAEKVWSALASKLVRGSNVRQAMQYAESGNAEVALIAHSLALHGGGSFTLVDPSLHKALDQSIVVLTRTKKRKKAQDFIRFLSSDAGLALLAPYGLHANSNSKSP